MYKSAAILLITGIILGLLIPRHNDSMPDSAFLNAQISKRFETILNWETQYIGEKKWCANKNKLADYEKQLKKIKNVFSSQLSEIDINLDDKSVQEFVGRLMNFQSEMAYSWWQAQDPLKPLENSKTNLSDGIKVTELLNDEIDYINRNQIGRFFYNHEFSKAMLLFKPKSLPKDRLILDIINSYSKSETIKLINDKNLKLLVQSTMNFGWNLTGLLSFELVKTQYCEEISRADWNE